MDDGGGAVDAIKFQRLREAFQRDPVEYAAKLKRFVRLGYLVYGGVALASVAVLFLSGYAIVVQHSGSARLAVYAGIAVFAVVSGLFFKIEPPQNSIHLDRTKFPQAYAKLDEIADRLGAPRPHLLVVTPGDNAFAMRITKLGFFTRPRVVVGLGAAVLARFGPEELTAVLAHELAHHAHGDTSSSLRAASAIEMWRKVLSVMSTRGLLAMPARAFLDWYVPRLEQMTQVTSQSAEFQADAAAARVAGAENMATGLLRVQYLQSAVTMPALTSFYRLGRTHETVPDGFAEHLQSFQPPAGSGLAAGAIRSALSEAPDPQSTHPTLRERLEALDHPISLEAAEAAVQELERTHTASIDWLFGHSAGEVRALIDGSIKDSFRSGWADNSARLKFLEAWVAEFDQRGQHFPPSWWELLRKARIVEELSGEDAGYRVSLQALATAPDHPYVILSVASESIAVGIDVERAVRDLEHLAEFPGPYQKPAVLQLYRGYLMEGRGDEAARMKERYESLGKAPSINDPRGEAIRAGEPLEPWRLSPLELQMITAALEPERKRIRRVFAVLRGSIYDPSVAWPVLSIDLPGRVVGDSDTHAMTLAHRRVDERIHPLAEVHVQFENSSKRMPPGSELVLPKG